MLAQTGEFEEDDNVLSSAPLVTGGHMPPCEGDSTCPAQFLPLPDAGCSAILGNGRALPCTCGAGSTVATVAYQGPSQTLPRLAWTNISDTSACSVAAGDAADAGLAAVFTGDHTVSCAYFNGAAGAKVALSYGVNPGNGFYVLGNSNVQGVWVGADAGIANPTAAVSPVQQWVVQSLYRAGTTFGVRANGTAATVTSSIVTVAPSARNLYLGRYDSASIPIGGSLAGCTMWSVARSAADLTRDEALWFGTVAETRNVTTTRASSGCWEPAADAGPMVKCVGVNAGRQDSRGLFSYTGEASVLGSSADLTAWSAAAGETVVATAVADPMGGTTMDTMSSTLGTLGNGLYLAGTVTSSVGPFTFSVWGASTDGGWHQAAFSIRGLALNPDGGVVFESCACTTPDAGACPTIVAGGYCSASPTFGPSPARVSITATAYSGVAQTTLRGYVQGSSPEAIDAGTHSWWGAKLVATSVPGPVVLCGAAPCSSAGDNHYESTVGFPTASGELSLDFTPLNSGTLTESAYVVDTTAASSVAGVSIYVAGGNLRALTRDASNQTAIITSGLTWVGGTTYRLRLRWGSGNSWLYRNGVLVASRVDGTAKIPLSHHANCWLGNSNGSLHINGWVRNLQVSR
ncbi:MAG: hypothetical protein WC718_19560 [Phycisphaerales bacterium]